MKSCANSTQRREKPAQNTTGDQGLDCLEVATAQGFRRRYLKSATGVQGGCCGGGRRCNDQETHGGSEEQGQQQRFPVWAAAAVSGDSNGSGRCGSGRVVRRREGTDGHRIGKKQYGSRVRNNSSQVSHDVVCLYHALVATHSLTSSKWQETAITFLTLCKGN